MQGKISLLRIKKILKNIISLVILGILIFGFVCTGGHHNTIISESERSTNINTLSISSDQPCCLTNISHSFNSWKDVLVSIPEKIGENMILLVLGIILSIVFNWFLVKPYKPDQFVLELKLYLKKILNFKLFNYLLIVFALGILNPKIY